MYINTYSNHYQQTIDHFHGAYAFLSNFYPSRIYYRGYWYANNEAAFQAQKTLSPKEQLQFTKLRNPKDAKKLGAADRLKVFDKIMAKAKEYGIAPDRIHIDPLVEMLCTSEDGIATNIETITSVREQYPTIHITAAISNISFNLPVRKLINYGFLVLAMNAGLDSGIMDPTNKDMLGLVYATEALLGLDDYCMEYIGDYREGLIGTTKKK